jgi:glycosyltransferase involved in cell wall biosynthesis
MYRRHAWRAAFAAWREQIRTQPDVLYLDHLDSFMYASVSPTAARPPAVIDLHNVYSLLTRRASEEQPSGWKRTWLDREARQLARIESEAARTCSTVFAVSGTESSYFERLGARQVQTVPNGVDVAALADLPVGRTGPPVVMFLGTMSWRPNVSAAHFLARTVLPALRQRVPDVRLLIVGRDPPDDVRRLQSPEIDVTGTVPDVKPYLAQATVLAVPLDAGGGTRLKILEAFAAGLPVVSTRVGAEGIDAAAGTHYVGAEPSGFADALADLLSEPATGVRLAQAARELARTSYDWRAIGDTAAARIVELGGRMTTTR